MQLPSRPGHELPEADDLARRLERTCPGCGQRSIDEDGVCDRCGARKAPQRVPDPLADAKTQTNPPNFVHENWSCCP
jgi:hypothetical protein